MSAREPENCYDYELLISKACDGECTPEEAEAVKAHLRTCAGCRETLAAYREIRDAVAAHAVSLSCQPVPPVKERRHPVLRLITSRAARRYAGRVAAIAASVLLFALGHHMGFAQASRLAVELPSPAAVSTPSMWAVNRPMNAASLASVESEGPFNESIGRYRAAVGMELRQPKVDWMRIRELVEAMGELRTDLELLTLHMAFLDIRTGVSPAEVADHWERLSAPGKAVLKQ